MKFPLCALAAALLGATLGHADCADPVGGRPANAPDLTPIAGFLERPAAPPEDHLRDNASALVARLYGAVIRDFEQVGGNGAHGRYWIPYYEYRDRAQAVRDLSEITKLETGRGFLASLPRSRARVLP